MNDSRPGSPDGIEVRQYRAGMVYDLTDRLARVFLSDGACSPAEGTESDSAPVFSPDHVPGPVSKAEGARSQPKAELVPGFSPDGVPGLKPAKRGPGRPRKAKP